MPCMNGTGTGVPAAVAKVPARVVAALGRELHTRTDDVDFLAAVTAVVAIVRVEPAHADSRRWIAGTAQRVAQHRDRGGDALDGEQVGHFL